MMNSLFTLLAFQSLLFCLLFRRIRGTASQRACYVLLKNSKQIHITGTIVLKFTQPFAHISMLASEALYIAVLLDHPDFPDLLNAPNQMEPLPQPSRPLGPPHLSNLTDLTDFSDLTDLSDHPYSRVPNKHTDGKFFNKLINIQT